MEPVDRPLPDIPTSSSSDDDSSGDSLIDDDDDSADKSESSKEEPVLPVAVESQAVNSTSESSAKVEQPEADNISTEVK